MGISVEGRKIIVDSKEYTATFEIYPEVTLGDFSKMKIEKPMVEIADADVDQMLETIRKQHVSWTEVDRAAQAGDKVKVDFAGTDARELVSANFSSNSGFRAVHQWLATNNLLQQTPGGGNNCGV